MVCWNRSGLVERSVGDSVRVVLGWVEGRQAVNSAEVWFEDVLVEGDARVADGSVDRVEKGGVLAAEIVPPVTHEVLLVEDSTVGAEEGILTTAAVTDVEHLAASLHVGIIPRVVGDEVTGKGGEGNVA